MIQLRVALFGAASLLVVLSSSVVRADTITASAFSPLPQLGMTVIDLSGIAPPSQDQVVGDGYSIEFSDVGDDQGVVQGTTNVHLAPLAGAINPTTPEYLTGGFGSDLTTDLADSGNYLSTGLGTITITFSSPQTSLALLWGSVDLGNSLAFDDAAEFVVSGADVRAAAANIMAPQGPPSFGGVFIVVDTSSPFTTVTATSSQISFESAGIAAAMEPFTVVPERGTLILCGIGLLACAVSRYHAPYLC
jgi:hypothetical protein